MPEELHAKPRIGFVQLQKYNRDTGEFEGVMASSAPDGSREILDWDTSKPHFQRWFNQFHRSTGGASLGNVREMHQPIAAGKITYARFDDDKKQLYIKGRVFEPTTKIKLEEAVLTGLSIGGDYGKRWDDPGNPGFVRYEAKPYEVSLVDNPCNPEAMLALTNAQGEQTMVKFAAALVEFEADDDPAQDAEELARLRKDAATATRDGKQLTASDYAYVPDPSKPSTWKYPVDSAARVRNALARWGQDKGIPDGARRKAWARILRAADKFSVDVKDRSYKTEGARSMTDSPDAIVAEELRKQEQAKAEIREALFGDKGVLVRVVKAKKALKRFFKRYGEAGGLKKTYVSTIAGYLNDLSGQITSLQSAFTPAVAAGMPSSPGNSQPGENVGGGTGAMVIASPSQSGTGAMVPGVGFKADVGGKKGKKKGLSKKKIAAMIESNNATLQKSLAETLVALLRAPTAEEAAALERAAGGGTAAAQPQPPVRLLKDASDANKVVATGGGAATATAGVADEPSEHMVATLSEKAGDVTDPVGAAKAKEALDKIGEAAVRKALGGGREPASTGHAAGFRPMKTG